MVISMIKMVDRLEPPPGLDWDQVIARPIERARVLSQFYELALRWFRRSASDIRLCTKVWIDGDGGRVTQSEWIWHRDGCSRAGHIVCVLGEEPTEFMIGEVPESHLAPASDLSELEGRLKIQHPEPGQAILMDRDTIHRGPRKVVHNRMLLLAAVGAVPAIHD